MKEQFLKTYANIPIALRNTDIIYVLEDEKHHHEPMTWNACWLEIKNDTEISVKILQGLSNLKII